MESFSLLGRHPMDTDPLYINAKSNHPPTVVKHLPAAISSRLASISCNAEEFHRAKPIHEEALRQKRFQRRYAIWSTLISRMSCSQLSVPNKPARHYYGLTEGPFKTRYNGHTRSFRRERYRRETELSKYVWDLPRPTHGLRGQMEHCVVSSTI